MLGYKLKIDTKAIAGDKDLYQCRDRSKLSIRTEVETKLIAGQGQEFKD